MAILKDFQFNENCRLLKISGLQIRDPDKKAIEKAFRRLALKTHPDKVRSIHSILEKVYIFYHYMFRVVIPLNSKRSMRPTTSWLVMWPSWRPLRQRLNSPGPQSSLRSLSRLCQNGKRNSSVPMACPRPAKSRTSCSMWVLLKVLEQVACQLE